LFQRQGRVEQGLNIKPGGWQYKMYNMVTLEYIRRLEAIVGKENLIFGDRENMEPYSRDEISEEGFSSMPEVVVKPASAEEISAVMKLANEEMLPVTPRGGGSGLSGGAVPIFGGILLSLERMNRILEIDRENLMIVVQPGVITNEINRALQKEGLYYAGYPMSMESCFIGGNIAENAGGAKAVKYGVTGRYLHGLEVVLPTGEIINLGGKRVKDVTGYNLLHLMVGSEGTLGIFTSITLRLLPLPGASVSLLAPFEDMHSAIKAACQLIIETGILPAAAEFMDRRCVEASCRLLGERNPCPEAGSFLLIEVDGSPGQVEEDYNRAADHCLDRGALDVFVANTPSTREKFWNIRQRVSEALRAYYPEKTSEDIVVPPASIPLLVEEMERLTDSYGLESACFGHAGDGNMHVHLLKKEAMAVDTWKEASTALLEELYKAAYRLGGTISGEHGIGHKRKKYMPLVMGETELELIKKIKRAFDPNNILNPGKIIDL